MCFLLFDSDKEKYILYNKQELGKMSLVKCKSSEYVCSHLNLVAAFPPDQEKLRQAFTE